MNKQESRIMTILKQKIYSAIFSCTPSSSFHVLYNFFDQVYKINLFQKLFYLNWKDTFANIRVQNSI